MRWIFIPSLGKPRSSFPKKGTVQPGDAFEDTVCKPGFEIAKS
jgi:hypothetical protein